MTTTYRAGFNINTKEVRVFGSGYSLPANGFIDWGTFTFVDDNLLDDIHPQTNEALYSKIRHRAYKNGWQNMQTCKITIDASVNSLSALTFNKSTATQNQNTTINILGATPGSVLSGSVPTGMTLNSAARTITGTPTALSTSAIALTETLAGINNSPKSNTIPFAVAVAFAAANVSYQTGAANGSDILVFTLAPGETVTSMSPNDGRVILNSGGTKAVKGLTASSAGSIDYTFNTSAGRSITSNITATNSTATTIPVLEGKPKIAGPSVVGQTLNASNGLWLNNPTSYDVQWYRNGAALSGQISSTYALTSADLGQGLSYKVIPTNSFGSAAAVMTDVTPSVINPVVLAPGSASGGLTIPTFVEASPNQGINAQSTTQQITFTTDPNKLDFWNVLWMFNSSTANLDTATGIQIQFGVADNANGIYKPFIQVSVAASPGNTSQIFATNSSTVMIPGATYSCYIDAGGTIYTTMNGTILNDLTYVLTDQRFNQQTFLALKHGYQTPLSNVTIGPIMLPLALTAASATVDRRASVDIKYINSDGVAPTGYEIRLESLTGTVITSYHDAVVVASASAGVAKVEDTQVVPTAWHGGNIMVRLRQKNKTSAVATIPVNIPRTKRFGINLSGNTYYDWQNGNFRDWGRKMGWYIKDGTYNGVNGIDSPYIGMTTLKKAGIVDSQGRLLSWPTGATQVRRGTNYYPAPFEMGDRILKLAPGQDFSLANEGSPLTGLVEIKSKNLSTGVHVLTFSNNSGSDHADYSNVNWSIVLDQATFVPGGDFTLRKVGDNTNLILCDEYVNALAPMQVLRLMDLLNSNNGGIWDTFTDRLNIDWSAEAIVELINRTRTIPYFSYGYNTKPSVAAQYMQYFEANIDPIIPYFIADPSNEVWGGIGQLLTQFAYQSILSGRYGNGYQAPIAAADIYRPNGGGYASSGVRITTTSGSPTITLTTEATAGTFALGQEITAAGIPAGTRINAKVSGGQGRNGSTYTLSANATASGTNVVVTTSKGVANGYESGTGVSLGVSITSGKYVASYVSGGPPLGLFQAKRTTALTAALPTVSNGTIADNDDFHYVDGLGDATAFEYGAYGYALQTAIAPVSPRTKMVINIQRGDANTPGSFSRRALDYATTQGGSDTWGSIIDGIAVAPYATVNASVIEAATPGSARVQAFKDQFDIGATESIANSKGATDGISAYFALKNRGKSPLCVVYECGLEGALFGYNPGLVADYNTYKHLNTTKVQLQDYYDKLFNVCNASVVVAYQFGPGRLDGQTSVPNGDYSHFETVTDTTSARAAADIATGLKYRALV